MSGLGFYLNSFHSNVFRYLKSILRKPMTVLKHHYWLNFTEHGMEPPTWINVMREPISWFESRFWFKRHGWIHKERVQKSSSEVLDSAAESNFTNHFSRKELGFMRMSKMEKKVWTLICAFESSIDSVQL